MHTITVKLKQHTPLLHFQHEQYGATLRASDVKPRLDKYILSELSDCDKANGKTNGWIKTKEKRSWLDYKMSIVSSGTIEEFMFSSDLSDVVVNTIKECGINLINESPFFAQREEDKIVATKEDWNIIGKKGIIDTGNNGIVVYLRMKDNELANKLLEHLTSFFVLNNFGTRQDKGFGSFLPISIQEDETEIRNTEPTSDDIERCFKSKFRFVYKKELSITDEQDRFTVIFNTIKEDYQKLKSGKQNKDSELTKYLRTGDSNGTMRMEDQYFKAEIEKRLEAHPQYQIYSIEKKASGENQTQSNLEYVYARALLGLAEQYEYSLYQRNNSHNGKREKANDATAVVKVLKDKRIERFQSPICFKVINNTIYIVGNNVEGILGNSISFNYYIKVNNNLSPNPLDNGSLNIPSSFDLEKFMKYAMNPKKDNSLNYKSIETKKTP